MTAIIFDLDGTLLYTIQDLADSMNLVLKEENLPTHPVQAYKLFVGEGIGKLVERALPQEARIPARLARCQKRMNEIYERRWNVTSRLYEGMEELLNALVQKQIRLALFSNKPQEFTQKIVNSYLKKWTFEVALGATTLFPRKPDPQGALHIAATMKLSPGQFLYLGDSGTDMKTAKAAGMFAVGCTWGYRGTSELLSTGAQKIINHPGELLALL